MGKYFMMYTAILPDVKCRKIKAEYSCFMNKVFQFSKIEGLIIIDQEVFDLMQFI